LLSVSDLSFAILEYFSILVPHILDDLKYFVHQFTTAAQSTDAYQSA